MIQVGYCTNVHAGPDFQTMRANLVEHATAVRRHLNESEGSSANLPVGLWLSAESAKQLIAGQQLVEFRSWLIDEGLVPYTLNGFPYGDFHQPVVKHKVYLPTWQETQRVEFTLNLIDILDRLLPESEHGTISTLPLQWGAPVATSEQLNAAAKNLVVVAEKLRQLEDESGRLIQICIEPEPGCALSVSDDVVNFFNEHLLRQGNEDSIRRYLTVCHDVCHAVVMFEEQSDVLRRYADEGIGVGKVQISSAVIANWNEIAPMDRAAALDQLRAFAEDRYLHQTSCRNSTNETTFYGDLPEVIAGADAAADSSWAASQWRTHFHVPIYLESFGLLNASRWAVEQCVEAMRQYHPQTEHYEVETYAWGVLPPELKKPTLSEGIAEEMRWFRGVIETSS